MHLLASDGEIGSVIEQRAGVTRAVSAYALGPLGQSAGSLVSEVKQLKIESVGTEEIAAPAEMFFAEHYRTVNYKADLLV